MPDIAYKSKSLYSDIPVSPDAAAMLEVLLRIEALLQELCGKEEAVEPSTVFGRKE